MDLICTASAQTSFARPRIDLARPFRCDDFRPCLDYILRVCQSLLGSFLQLGKLHWFLYLVLFSMIHSMFTYRRSSNFVEKLRWKGSNGGRDAISCLLPCVIYCMEGEFEQIVSKIRLSKGKQQLTPE